MQNELRLESEATAMYRKRAEANDARVEKLTGQIADLQQALQTSQQQLTSLELAQKKFAETSFWALKKHLRKVHNLEPAGFSAGGFNTEIEMSEMQDEKTLLANVSSAAKVLLLERATMSAHLAQVCESQSRQLEVHNELLSKLSNLEQKAQASTTEIHHLKQMLSNTQSQLTQTTDGAQERARDSRRREKSLKEQLSILHAQASLGTMD